MRFRLVLLAGLLGFAFAAGVVAKPTLALLRTGNPADHPSHQMRLDQFRHLNGHASQIVMLGDSHIQNGEWAEWLDLSVANRGIGQNTTFDVLARLDAVPDSELAVLLIGSNDLERGEAPQQVAERIRRIVEALGRPVLVLSVPPRSGRPNAQTNELNCLNKRHCEAGHCKYVDLHPAIAPTGDLDSALTRDGVHLNGEGYERVVSILRSAL